MLVLVLVHAGLPEPPIFDIFGSGQIPTPTPTPTPALSPVENVQKTTETVTLKRRRPNVAHPSEEDTLAEELGEDAELQAAIAASLGK